MLTASVVLSFAANQVLSRLAFTIHHPTPSCSRPCLRASRLRTSSLRSVQTVPSFSFANATLFHSVIESVKRVITTASISQDASQVSRQFPCHRIATSSLAIPRHDDLYVHPQKTCQCRHTPDRVRIRAPIPVLRRVKKSGTSVEARERKLSEQRGRAETQRNGKLDFGGSRVTMKMNR